MNQNERKTVVRRMILLIAAACAVMGLFVLRLIFLQLVNGDDFKAKATKARQAASRHKMAKKLEKELEQTIRLFRLIIFSDR